MSFFKSLVDSLSDLFAGENTASTAPPPPPAAAEAEEVAPLAGTAVMGERVVNKLKGYFELSKEEIDKAVRAEEWGLPDDAIAHYRNALRILLEAKAVRVPEILSSSERQKLKAHQDKISKWHDKVYNRLKHLTEKTGSSSLPSKINLGHTRSRTGPSTSVPQRAPSMKPSPKSTALATGSPKGVGGDQRPTKKADNNYESRLIEDINSIIVDRSPAVKWDDIAGLDKAKQALMEMVILPTKRRDLFTGLRKPARGLLLFGPPGNGKTMLAKGVASESGATFFNVSPSSLVSKWVGEAEKLVRTLFMVAAERQPSVIFIDEIDSIMSTRLANENDASRRLKSEFLIQFDGVASNPNDLVIVIGATNKPQELDDAVLRRMVKRIYIPLPDENVRRNLLKNLLTGQFSLPAGDLERVVRETEGYSGSDLQALCQEAALIPVRELGHKLLTSDASQVRPLRYGDFKKAMTVIRPSLQKSRWEELEQWNKEFGSN